MIIKSLNAVGVYGNASLNSVDLALISTDGVDVQRYIKTQTVHYPEELCTSIRSFIGRRGWNYETLNENAEMQNYQPVSREIASASPRFVMES